MTTATTAVAPLPEVSQSPALSTAADTQRLMAQADIGTAWQSYTKNTLEFGRVCYGWAQQFEKSKGGRGTKGEGQLSEILRVLSIPQHVVDYAISVYKASIGEGVPCEHCPETFPSKAQLRKHQDKMHADILQANSVLYQAARRDKEAADYAAAVERAAAANAALPAPEPETDETRERKQKFTMSFSNSCEKLAPRNMADVSLPETLGFREYRVASWLLGRIPDVVRSAWCLIQDGLSQGFSKEEIEVAAKILKVKERVGGWGYRAWLRSDDTPLTEEALTKLFPALTSVPTMSEPTEPTDETTSGRKTWTEEQVFDWLKEKHPAVYAHYEAKGFPRWIPLPPSIEIADKDGCDYCAFHSSSRSCPIHGWTEKRDHARENARMAALTAAPAVEDNPALAAMLAPLTAEELESDRAFESTLKATTTETPEPKESDLARLRQRCAPFGLDLKKSNHGSKYVLELTESQLDKILAALVVSE